MSVFLANGEWAEGSLKLTTYDDAVDGGVKEFAKTRQKTTFSRERTMLCRGIATYIEIPDEFDDEIRSNQVEKPTAGLLSSIVGEQRRHNITRNWTGGLFHVPAAMIRAALKGHQAPDQESDIMMMPEVLPAWMVPDFSKPTVEQLISMLDLGRCPKSGPVLYVDAKTWRFEDGDPNARLHYLTALYDPHAYGFSATDPTLAHQVRPGFRGSQTGYATKGYETDHSVA